MSLFTLRYRDTQLKGEGGRAFPIMDYGGLIQCMEEVRNFKKNRKNYHLHVGTFKMPRI